MLCRMRRLYQVSAIRIKLVVGGSEVVVYRCALKYALLYAVSFAKFVVVNLQYNAEALYKEDAAQYREHKLLVYDNCCNGNDTANGQRACIAHKYLCWVGIVPQEAYQCTNECA